MKENNKHQNLQENEIDLIELFKTIWDKRFFIIIFTVVITIFGIIYAYSKQPLYEVKAVLEIGSFSNNRNSNYIENPQTLIKKLEILNINNIDRKLKASISSISLVNSTPNLIEIVSQSDSNKEALKLLDKIVNDLKSDHKRLVDAYKSLIIENINNLKAQKDLLEKDENKFEGSLSLKFDLISKIDALELSISAHSIQSTKEVGKYIKNDYPIKPKKKHIVAVAFVMGFILSIFIVFFMQFIQSLKKCMV